VAPGPTPEAPGGGPAERTALAWGRSSLAIVAIAATITKSGLEAHESVVAVAAGVLLLGAAGVVSWTGARMSAGRLAADREGSQQARRSVLAVLTAASVFSACVAFVIALLA
jgi:uncharacterized membrane protein YidH (DUF202 family)